MSHLRLVPALPVKLLPPLPTCYCAMSGGRYWFQGSWNCTATDEMVRFYPTIGWHHWAGHQTINIDIEEQAA